MRANITRGQEGRCVAVRSAALLLTALCLSCALGSCGRSEEGAAGGKASGGSLVVGLLSDPNTLNPLAATTIEEKEIINLMFLRLLDEEADYLHFRPMLAERWEFSEDSLTVTFHLRRDAVWADGVPVTAEDVRFTWELQVDPDVAWPSRNLKDRIENVEAVDDHTVAFRYTNRYRYQLMDANDGVIIPKHALENTPRSGIKTSGFGRDPVGNGPFKLSQWVSGQFVELVKNPLYHDKDKPRLDKVVFRIVPEMTTLITQLKSGEIDCLESIPSDAAADIVLKYPDVKIYRYASRSMSFIAWNLQNELFRSTEVRRALGMAINTREMVETLWNGMARTIDSPMHPILWAYDPNIERLPHDPERAKRILEQQGWVDGDGDGIRDRAGRPFEFEMITNQGNQLRKDIATMAQEYLRRIGVRVSIRVLEFNTFIQHVVQGDYESCVLGWRVGTRADLTEFWHSGATPPGGFNVSRYSNPVVDDLIDRAKNTLDTEEARALWHECQAIIYRDQPICFVAIPDEVVGLRRGFCEVQPNPIGFFVNLPDWYLSESCP